jgi:arylformamidase
MSPARRTLYDITPVVSGRIAVWPGDTPFSREVLLDLGKGDNLTLSTIRSTVHVGAHADAPSHFTAGAPSIENRPLDLYLGPCQVIRAAAERGTKVLPDSVSGSVRAERLLIATGTFPDPDRFNPDFAALSPELIHHLHEHGVRLVGIDTPSVDLHGSQDLPTHRACLERDMAILEGLTLEGVPDGLYELIALPLRLEGLDASPVRAVLRSLG